MNIETRFARQPVDALANALIVGSLVLAMAAIAFAVRLLVG